MLTRWAARRGLPGHDLSEGLRLGQSISRGDEDQRRCEYRKRRRRRWQAVELQAQAAAFGRGVVLTEIGLLIAQGGWRQCAQFPREMVVREVMARGRKQRHEYPEQHHGFEDRARHSC